MFGVGVVLVGTSAGVASALFLSLLATLTDFRVQNPALVWWLPVSGLLTGWLYHRWGRSILGGVDLVLDRTVDGGPQLPARMAPMVLVGTWITHLFGGSAGREGTAVQMGAAMADSWASRLGFEAEDRRRLLRAGVAAGFSSAFGTPLAGAVFALEFSNRRILPTRDGAISALVAAFIGSFVCDLIYAGHAHYPTLPPLPITQENLLAVLALTAAVALCVRIFVESKGRLAAWFKHHLPALPARMFVGGLLVVLLWQLAGRDDFLGLGVPQILASFEGPVGAFDFAWKLLFTVVTLAAGFLGGEVTPLFYVGATLGNSIATLFSASVPHLAGLGLAAMFGAAAGTPIALALMAGELFGWAILPPALAVCLLARVLRGEGGIYAERHDA